MVGIERAAFAVLLCCSSCAPFSTADYPGTTELRQYRPAQETKCNVSPRATKPLLVDWPASDRAELQTVIGRGVAVVRFDACSRQLELLSRCKAPGKYGYVSVSPETKQESISTEDELYAKMPVGAAGLEARLGHGESLDVSITIVGRHDADGAHVRTSQLAGPCEGATHVIAGVNVGAFELSAGTATELGGGVDIHVAKAGAKSKAKRQVLNRSGEAAACDSPGADGPPSGCSSVVSLDLVKLDAIGVATAACPAGSDWDGDVCVRTRLEETVACPAESQWDGTACVAHKVRTEVECPTDTVWDGERCLPNLVQCPDGDVEQCVVNCRAGHPGSCTTLAVMYLTGQGLDKDVNRSVELLRRACTDSDGRGCAQLGAQFTRGTGVEKDARRAVRLYEKACDLGSASGCVASVQAIASGKGTARFTSGQGTGSEDLPAFHRA